MIRRKLLVRWLLCALLLAIVTTARAQDSLELQTGAATLGDATFGIASFAIEGTDLRPARGLEIASDGAQADSLRPAVQGNVSLMRTRVIDSQGTILLLDSLANHGRSIVKVRLRWTSFLPGDRAEPLTKGTGWQSGRGWRLESGVKGKLVNGWPAGLRAYPGHDPGYIGWELRLTVRPGERKALLAVIAPPGKTVAPDFGWLSKAQRAALVGWPGGRGGRALLAGKPARLAEWQRLRQQWGAEALIEDSLAHAAWLESRYRGLAPVSNRNPRAFAEARAISPDDDRPLAGLPVLIKDIIDVAGLPTLTLAAPLPRIELHDAAIVSRLREAGAVILGKTTYDEDFGDYGMHRSTGRLRGLFHPDVTVTGSSGGSAVAVAAGIVPIAIGSDTCGSLGTPASHAGIVALRPSMDTLPYRGTRPLDPDYDTVGPMIADAGDLPEVMQALSRGPGETVAPEGLHGLRLGLVLPWPRDLPAIDPAVAQQFNRAVARLRAAGVELVPIALPGWPEARAALRAAPDPIRAARAVEHWLSARGDQRTISELASSPYLLRDDRDAMAALLEARSDEKARTAHDAALEVVREAVAEPIRAQQVSALILPATLAWPGLLDVTRVGAGEPSICPLSALARLPQATVPLSTEPDEPPLGAALIGLAGKDAALSNLAALLAPVLAKDGPIRPTVPPSR